MPITLLRQQKAGQAASNSTITSAQQDGNNENLDRSASVGRSITRLQTQLKATVTTQHQTNWALLNVILSTFIFLVVSAFELMIIVNLLNFVNITFGKELSGSSSILGIYFGIFIAGMFFQFLGALDAYWETNTLQIVAVGCFNFLGVAYAVVQINQVSKFKKCATNFVNIIATTVAGSVDQYQQIHDLQTGCYFDVVNYSNGNYTLVSTSKSLSAVANDINDHLDLFNIFPPFQYVILAIMLIGSLTGVFFAYKSYQQVGWHVFSIQGADIQKKKMMQRYHLFLLFLKLNAFFLLIIAAQYIMETYFNDKNTDGKASNILMISFAVTMVIFGVYYVLGYFAMKRSNYIMAGFFLLMLMVNFLVSIVVLWRVYIQAASEFISSRIWLTVFVSVQIVSNIVTYIFSVLLILDFKDGGLLSVVQNMEKRKPGKEADQEEDPARRFTLD